MEKKTPKRDLLNELGMEDSIVFENPDYDSAIIGFDENSGRVIYDIEKMIEHLMDEDNISYDDALDFISYNTLRALPYAGENGPIVMRNIDIYL